MFLRKFVKETKHTFCDKNTVLRKIMSINTSGEKILQTAIRFGLVLNNLLIKDQRLRNSPSGQLGKFE
jgi:hypothetical protein